MIDDFNHDRTGWARFSDDRVMRYRLARSLNGLGMFVDGDRIVDDRGIGDRIVFVLLNPSTADAFKPDPTVSECIKHATRWGCDIVEVVNLFAFRSTYPTDLKKCAHGQRGDDHENNVAIMAACRGANLVIAAWGNHGYLDGRASVVRERIQVLNDIPLHHLGLTKEERPKHPLARGKHRIAADIMPTLWEAP